VQHFSDRHGENQAHRAAWSAATVVRDVM
jgi:hypothetical protein